MKVYKLKSTQGSGIEQIIGCAVRGEIFFSTPKTLNDPLEYACLNTFDAAHAGKVAFWSNNPDMKKALAGMTPKGQADYIEQLEKKLRNESPAERIYQNESQGIWCTCSTWQNLVLWSHYADMHRGVAVEVETDGVPLLERPTIVDYVDQVRTTPFYEGTHINEVLRTCATKFSDWRYEREVRFFTNPGLHTIPITAITGVVFGMNARKQNWDHMRRIFSEARAGNANCRFYEVTRDRATYQMNLSELDRNAVLG